MLFRKRNNYKDKLLDEKSLYEDSYILFKNGKVSSDDLMDIEVCLVNHSYIKSKVMIDINENIEHLCKMICQIVEKYPKLSGLNGLKAVNLFIKTDRGPLYLKNEKEIISDSIRSNDTVYFDLQFSEIWLEVEMTLKCEDKSICLLFELKVESEFYITELRNVLIKLGIKSWVKSILESDNNDIYLFSKFMIDISNNGYNLEYIELDNIYDKVGDKFNFESKIRCNLEFANLNKILLKELYRYLNNNPEKMNSFKSINNKFQKRKLLIQLINEYLQGYLKSEEFSLSQLDSYKKVIWKRNSNENEVSKRLNSHIHNHSNDISRRESIAEDFKLNYFDFIGDRSYKDAGNLFLKIHSKDSLMPKHNFRRDKKYSEDIKIVSNLPIIDIINQNSGSIYSNKNFNLIDLPSTRNLQKLKTRNSEYQVSRNQSDVEDKFKFIKKKQKVVTWIIVIIFIFIILNLIL